MVGIFPNEEGGAHSRATGAGSRLTSTEEWSCTEQFTHLTGRIHCGLRKARVRVPQLTPNHKNLLHRPASLLPSLSKQVLRRPKRSRLYSPSGVSVHVFTGVPFRFSAIFILVSVGAVSALFRISMALYWWGRGCFLAQ